MNNEELYKKATTQCVPSYIRSEHALTKDDALTEYLGYSNKTLRQK